ncbi:MAG: AAA family ATPase [Treponema sp.]|nr:AAA family ATPase [Treponema sp.]
MTINTQQLNFILENTPAEQNIMLVGKHGIGKSRILEDFFSTHGQKVVTLFLGQMSDPGDLIGLPHLDEKTGKTEFMLPYWFPVDGKPIVLFLDELNRARPEVLQTVMDLTLNRKLAGKTLPKGSRIISAVNGGNEYQLTDLDPALVSRFNIYEFAPSVEDWLDWAKSAELDSRVINFIEENPEYLDGEADFSAENLERTPDRRSWERVSSIIKPTGAAEIPLTPMHKYILSGIVGDTAAVTFCRFVQENELPSAKSVLCGAFEAVVPQLKKLSVVQFCRLNEAVFRFTETFEGEAVESDISSIPNASGAADDISKNVEYTGSSKTSPMFPKNLKAYFDFLLNEVQKEVSAHFVSLCSAERFPKTLVLITKNFSELYKKMLSAIDEL